MTEDEIKEQLECIEIWQTKLHAHPLTCGGWNCRADLIGERVGDSVRLKCPLCEYVQDWVPQPISHAKELLESQKKWMEWLES